MTRNQLEYWRNRETQRSNRVNEAETQRSNKAREAENQRSNMAREAETARHDLAVETETNRSNLARERETQLTNYRNWKLSLRAQNETENMNKFYRSQNRQQIAETVRTNQANEQIRAQQVSLGYSQLELQKIVQEEVQRANQAREFTNQYVARTNYELGQQRNLLQVQQIAETQRSNMASETLRRQQNEISQRNLIELTRHNVATESEIMRSHLANEAIQRQVAITNGVTNIISSAIRSGKIDGSRGGILQ